MTNYQRFAHILFWLGLLTLTISSLLPQEDLPKGFMFWDKAQHFLAYAFLAIAGRWAYPTTYLSTVLGLAIYGGLIELAQSLSGWRQGDWVDVLANLLGILFVVLIVKVFETD